MRYFGRWPFASGAALLLICGCAGGPSTGPTVTGSDPAGRAIDVELVADKPSPWGRSKSVLGDEPAPPAAAASPGQSNWLAGIFGKKIPEKGPTPTRTAQTTRRPPLRERSTTTDEETREFFERELADATPAERDALYREWQGLDPQMFRQMIKVWKMGKAVEKQGAEPAGADSWSTAEGARSRSRNDVAPAGYQQNSSDSDEAPPSRSRVRGSNDDQGSRSGTPDDRGPAPRSNRNRDGYVSQAQYADTRDSYGTPGSSRGYGSGNRNTRNSDYNSPPPVAGNRYDSPGYESSPPATRSWSIAPDQGPPPRDPGYNSRQPNNQFRNYGANGLGSNGLRSNRTPLNANPVTYSGDSGYRSNPVQLSQNPEDVGYGSDQYQSGPPTGSWGNPGDRLPDTRRNLGSLVPGNYQGKRNFLNPSPGYAGQNPGNLQTNYDNNPGSGYGGNNQLPVWGQGNSLPQPGPGGAPFGASGSNNQFAPNQFSGGQPFPSQPGFGQPATGQFPGGASSPVQRAAWQSNLQQVIAAAEAQTAGLKIGTTEQERQTYIESHVYLRMLYLMAGQQDRALHAIPGLDPADQEFWQQMFWGVSNYFDTRGIPGTSDRASQTVAQLTSAVQQLQSKANLELRNVSFCQKISSFGNYERFAREEFTPGQPVLLYAEVQNFRSEPTSAGQYRTVLRSVVEFYKPGSQSELLDRIEFNPTEDVCKNFRRDYFHSYEFAIPAKLSLGPHVMKLTVEDQLSHRVSTYTLNFTVH